MRRLEDSRGVAMVAVILLAVAMTILVSMFVFWIGEESKSSVKGVKSTKAFHLAEAALDRGRWKLQASNTFWTQTGEGTAITHYNFDKEFTDIEGGSYAIRITSHPTTSNRRLIEGVGRDNSTNEVRWIKGLFERQTLDAAIWSGGDVEVDGASSEVHWGPIKAQEKIDLSATTAAFGFPRKYAREQISNLDEDPASPNTDNLHYWAYYDVPPCPQTQQLREQILRGIGMTVAGFDHRAALTVVRPDAAGLTLRRAEGAE